MKQKIGTFFLIALFGGFLIYLLVSATLDLTNKKDVHTVQLGGAVELLEVKHTINGLIPIGTDYYYVGVDAQTKDSYVIKASKKWYEKNFGSDYKPLDANGVEITALSKKVSDYETSREMTRRISELKGMEFPLGANYSLELDYKAVAIKKIIMFVFSIILAVSGYFVLKNKGSIKPVIVKCWLVALIVWGVFFIRVVMLLG